jgi:hypothetical protein
VNESFELIYNDLNIENQESMSDDDMLILIADRVIWFLENDKDLLLSYLYRLDIEEEKIDKALSPNDIDPAHIAIGKLILQRQKQRIETKQRYKVEPIEGWEY